MKDSSYLEAEKKIAEALQSRATELDLSGMKLTELPDSLGQLTQLTELNLSSNKLTALPESLGQLTQLTKLDLSNNQLTSLPDSLGQLTHLRELSLFQNQLTTLPDTFEKLIYLTTLDLFKNQLTALPKAVQNLRNLKRLNLASNRLSEIPMWVGELRNLEYLVFTDNELRSLPESLRNLTSIEELHLGLQGYKGNPLGNIPECVRDLKQLKRFHADDCQLQLVPTWLSELNYLEVIGLSNNKISDLSSSLSQLEHLKTLELKDNPLNPALQSAYEQGLDGVKAYLRSLEGNAEPLYEAKLVLVGEGNVGKTTLLKALKGKKGKAAPKKGEATTHGVEIDIRALHLPHPTKKKVKIQLNAWDFGGQDVYRVTHQFFFSRRSLYLLVWEPRRGVQQGQVEDWLNMIRLRVGDDARVIIVSTHCKTGERIARIDQPVFKQQYGDMIVGFHEVDSLVPDPATGEMVGIAELKKVIAEHASKLDQMGMGFNRDWKAARDELLARPEPRISFGTFSGVCAARGLSGIDTETLAHLMHDLGYIVHYSDDEKLRDDVILKPEWLTKAIGFVLEDTDTKDAEGILPDDHLYKVWHEHRFEKEPRYDPEFYPFFLRLMEKYDVCYRLTDGKASLVAQHVPQVRPELPWLPEQEIPNKLLRIVMVCSMEEDPPGLVPWMIVRTHDFAVEQTDATGKIHRLHWDKGMFLRHPPHGEAMLVLDTRDREFRIYAQAAWPEHFMNILHSTLEKLINDNWRGLEGRYLFAVPCSEIIDGQPCRGRFPIHSLRKWLVEGDTTTRCQICSKKYSVAELLFGFEERRYDMQWDEIRQEMKVGFDGIHGHIDGLESRIANYFMATMRAIADEAKNGPRLFTFRSREAGLSPKQLFARPISLQLWCEAEGCQHPIIEDGKGLYPIDQPQEWVIKIAPYANFALDILKTVAPIAAPAINTFFGAKTTETLKIADQLSFASAILSKLPDEIKTPDRPLLQRGMVSEPERSGILALHRLLNELDPTQDRLGLHRVATYTGDYRWLCKNHYDAWQPNIPDVIPSHD
jgi:GTPase SAR1 family protein